MKPNIWSYLLLALTLGVATALIVDSSKPELYDSHVIGIDLGALSLMHFFTAIFQQTNILYTIS